MRFVKACEEDKNEIYALYRSLVGTEYCAWTENYPGMEEIDFDMSRDALYVLKNEAGEIVGTISRDDDENVESLECWSRELVPSVELSRLGVRPDYQNQGIAGRMIKNMMDMAKEQGKKSVHFLVCKTNIKALKAYDKLNFNNVGECEMFEEEWFCYEKEL